MNCLHPECARPARSLGYCSTCYMREVYWKREGVAEKERARRKLSGTNTRNAQQRTARYRVDPALRERVSASQRRARTGATAEWVANAREGQKGCCAVCSVELDRTHKRALNGEQVDHVPGTKVPRALLCGACNTSLSRYEKAQRKAGLVIDCYEMYLKSHR